MSEDNNNIFGTGEIINLDSSGDGLPEGFDPFGGTPEETAGNITPITQIPVQSAEKEQPPQFEDQADDDSEPDEDTEDGADPFAMALAAAENMEVDAAKESLFTKAPQFVYAGASEDIKDTSKTFEELRQDKEVDFPELDDSKRVSWTVEYGKYTKAVSDPKGTTIAKMKTDIEKSKEFADSLKKIKVADRGNVVCKIKPHVTAKSKGKRSAFDRNVRCGRDDGVFPSYKALFTTYDEAETSDKTICIIPARDGKVYEMRRTEVGTFVTPVNNVVELSEVRAGFIPALPIIPVYLLRKVIGFFRSFMSKEEQYEALVHILWDKVLDTYCVQVPLQTVSKISVNATVEDDLDTDRYIHVMDIHSHNDMPAKFSSIDDADEKATRLYAVIGHLDRYWPEISVRISNGGKYLEIAPELVFEDLDIEFPCEWTQNVTLPSFDGGDGL